MVDKIWLKSYPPSMPETVDVDTYHSINEAVEAYTTQFADKDAFESFAVSITYRELNTWASQFAAFLQQHLKMKKNDCFAIMLPNILQFPIALFGALRAGLIVTNINPLYKAREIAFQLKDSGAKAIIILENFSHELLLALPETKIKHVIVARIGDCLGLMKGTIANFVTKYVKGLLPDAKIPNAIYFKQAINMGKKLSLEKVVIHPHDIAFLQYTSGTTGVPKGAMLTHRNIMANTIQSATWIKPVASAGSEVIVLALPLYHILSLVACCFSFMSIGSKCILILDPRGLKDFIKILRRVPSTVLIGVNTLYNALLNHPDFDKINFSALKMVFAGGMTMQKSVADEWQRRTGSVIGEGYGLTEASPAVCMNPLTIKSFTGSVGLPLPDTEVTIQDEERNILPVGKEGELCVRGPQVMQGYWQKPEETQSVLDKEGWLHTGDIAKMDSQGFVYLLDRKKDMIIVSGFNVYPREVEEVISMHPGVREVAVIGVPNEATGEMVKAYIVKKDPKLTEQDVINHCSKQLTAYKLPKKIEFRDELPKSSVGKILHRILRQGKN